MRKPMVTRTFSTTHCKVLCVDVETQQTVNKEVTVPRLYPTEKKLLKAVKEMIESDTLKVVSIVERDFSKALFGMSEEEFISRATVLPDRGVKIDNEN